MDNIVPDHMRHVGNLVTKDGVEGWTCIECGSILWGDEARGNHECWWLRKKREADERKYVTEDGLFELTSRNEGDDVVYTLTATPTYQDRVMGAINSLIKLFGLSEEARGLNDQEKT